MSAEPANIGAPEPSTLRLAGTLTVAGVLAGLVLVGVYRWTQPIIKQNRAEALRRAVLEVLPGSTHMEARDSGAYYVGRDDAGQVVGYAIPMEGAGFQDTIRLIFGYDPKGDRVVGMRVLESKETPGLGDRIVKDAAFVHQFDNLSVASGVRLVKGKGDSRGPGEVDAISGATISSRAVVRLVNEGLKRWRHRLRGQESGGP